MPAGLGLVRPASGGGGATLFDELTADGPNLWWRCNDAAASPTMVAQAGSNGAWTGSGANSQPAIYAGGPTCVLTSASSTGLYSGTVPALNALSIFAVVRKSAVVAMEALICNDDGSSRRWQWRTNGTDMQFVKINIGGGSVVTETASGVLTAGLAQTMGVTVSASGVIKMYLGGANIFTGSATGGFDYGSAGAIQIGACAGGGGIVANANFSECAIFNQELSAARFAAYAAAAGC